ALTAAQVPILTWVNPEHRNWTNDLPKCTYANCDYERQEVSIKNVTFTEGFLREIVYFGPGFGVHRDTKEKYGLYPTYQTNGFRLASLYSTGGGGRIAETFGLNLYEPKWPAKDSDDVDVVQKWTYYVDEVRTENLDVRDFLKTPVP